MQPGQKQMNGDQAANCGYRLLTGRKMSIRLILIGVMAVLSNFSLAQSRADSKESYMRQMMKDRPYQGHYTLTESQAANYMLHDSLEIDRCRLEVVYSARIVLDTIGNFKCNDVAVVLSGDSIQKFYSAVWWRWNMNYTLFQLGRENEQVPIPKSVYQPAVDYEIYRYPNQRKLVNRHSLYALKNQLFEYEEPMPPFEWRIYPDTTTIAGYVCQKAESVYAGRQWTVWFTPEIPIDGGVWKFNGLPGLILEAYDAQDYFHFTATKIHQPQKGITYYRVRTKKMSRKTFRELEAKTFRNPFPTASQGMGVVNPSTKKMEFLPLDWQMPYNPIERE